MKFIFIQKKWSLLIAIVALISLQTACTSKSQTPIEESHDESVVLHTVTTSQFKAANFQTGKLAPQTFNSKIKTYGTFDVAPENKAVVSTFFGGFVKSLTILPGQKVHKGDKLVVLENPDFIKVQQEFLEAKGSLGYLEKEYERQKNLVADNSTSQKNFLKAESDYKITKSKFQSLKMQLEMMNINTAALADENIKTTITLTAPISGYVTHVGTSIGVFVDEQTEIFTIINTEHMHLELNIYERDLTQVRVGQTIKFHVQNNSHEEHFGDVYLINQAIDEENRHITIHGHVVDDHTEEVFIPGMYIEAEIYTSSELLLALPEEAVVTMDNRSFVLVKSSSTETEISFEQHEVLTGKTTKGFIEILNTNEFSEGTEFLIKGAFNLLTEEGSGGHSH